MSLFSRPFLLLLSLKERRKKVTKGRGERDCLPVEALQGPREPLAFKASAPSGRRLTTGRLFLLCLLSHKEDSKKEDEALCRRCHPEDDCVTAGVRAS